MREIRPYGSEGGVALTTPLLPLSQRLANAPLPQFLRGKRWRNSLKPNTRTVYETLGVSRGCVVSADPGGPHRARGSAGVRPAGQCGGYCRVLPLLALLAM